MIVFSFGLLAIPAAVVCLFFAPIALRLGDITAEQIEDRINARAERLAMEAKIKARANGG